MAETQVESLLAPIAADAPCGPDLEYDPAFQAMLEAGAGKPERQYGDIIYPAEAPDWALVHEQAVQLATRTRDLRVAVWLLRSGARVRGLVGAVDGLRLVQGLVERHWEHVHPPLDAADNNDPTARVMALTALAQPAAGLGDLRAATLTGKRGAVTVRDIELAFGAAAGAQVPAVVAPPSAIVVQSGLGPIASREDAIRALERACEWIERNEPSNPAPLLIRRSQRLMNRNFIDIVRELLPEGLDQIEKLAGTPPRA